MRTFLKFTGSERDFQVWEYQVAHGQLLIRSPKSVRLGQAPGTNLDLYFVGVKYIGVPRHLHGIQLLSPTTEEIQQMETLLGVSVPPSEIMILGSEGQRFAIVAIGLEASENDWDLNETCLDCRARSRLEP